MACVANESQDGGEGRDTGAMGELLCHLNISQCTQETFEDGSPLTCPIS